MSPIRIDKFKKQRFYIATLLVLSLVALLYITFGSPTVLWHNSRLKAALTALDEGTVSLDEAVPFDWDAVYTFDPYTSVETMAEVIGAESYNLREAVSEGTVQLVFMKDGAVTAAVCDSPSDLGYALAFTGEGGKGWARLDYGAGAQFAVSARDGVVYLDEISG